MKLNRLLIACALAALFAGSSCTKKDESANRLVILHKHDGKKLL